VTVDALTAGELLERTKGALREKLVDVLVPAAYLFYGVILLLAFNHAVPGIRNPGSYDGFLNHADWVLFHVNVSTLVHSCLARWPLWVFQAFEIIYYGMFIHITGTLIFLAAAKGRSFAVSMVRTIVICNTIGLIIYAAMPAIGPWANCALHQVSYPHTLPTYGTQEILHVAGPLIAFWFIRRFKWTARAYFAAYLLCLVPSVLLLEWHYVIDLVAGFALACFAIWISRHLSGRDISNEPVAVS
jgi:hypothetical protein